MVQIFVIHEFSVVRDGNLPLSAERLHREGERLMQALLDLEATNDIMADVATASDAATGHIIAEMLVTAEDELAALEFSQTIARTAIHAIGGFTPAWGRERMVLTTESVDERSRFVTSRVELQPA